MSGTNPTDSHPGTRPGSSAGRAPSGSEATTASSSGSGSGAPKLRGNYYIVVDRVYGQPCDEWTVPFGPNRLPTDHIICVDGTGNNQIGNGKHEHITNVAKISSIMEPTSADAKRTQTVVYQPGLGSIQSGLDHKINDLAFGFHFGKILRNLYRHLCVTWKEGDRIFLFGFSRGSYIARVLASFIVDVGIFDWKHDLQKQYNAYDLSDANVSEETIDLEAMDSFDKIIDEIFNDWVAKGVAGPTQLGKYKPHMAFNGVEIAFLGPFDTVASLGMPDMKLMNLQSTKFHFAEPIENRPRILAAAHACSLSESRINFKLVPFDGPLGGKTNQVLFPGYHSCIGGGSGDKGNTISTVTFIWMVCQFKHLLHINMKALQLMAFTKYGLTPSKKLSSSLTGPYLFAGKSDRINWPANIKLHIIADREQFKKYTGITKIPKIEGSMLKNLWKTLAPAGTGDEVVTAWEQAIYDKISELANGDNVLSKLRTVWKDIQPGPGSDHDDGRVRLNSVLTSYLRFGP
ncbi:hypothetical protein B0T26DRAFT_675182 [Lasiosphaeria miniovina]|uniref:T6SS Phospholipase effector Tle1-like catalytic domain-containing protein n=1 Tax=Lasiosphaeria miniovina TaxID=1954250 RepID=A0AA40DXK3_9PEZI|nr:uncharacterized protein B0T26DRAFT_675182 [Lasiosphaeria miniovina]KAK0716751.1 hypothetical protein B0T26DRAFT_675182 [Lasiosphaeria miniovina]